MVDFVSNTFKAFEGELNPYEGVKGGVKGSISTVKDLGHTFSDILHGQFEKAAEAGLATIESGFGTIEAVGSIAKTFVNIALLADPVTAIPDVARILVSGAFKGGIDSTVKQEGGNLQDDAEDHLTGSNDDPRNNRGDS